MAHRASQGPLMGNALNGSVRASKKVFDPRLRVALKLLREPLRASQVHVYVYSIEIN
jgi:hypothetical protein